MLASSPSVHHQALLERLRNKNALIGVVGLGYVGLPLSLTYTENGYRVLGLDIDNSKIEAIHKGSSYIQHIAAERVAEARKQQWLEGTTDFARAAEADALILCVPTPLNQYREPDLSFIRSTMQALVPHLRPGQVLSLRAPPIPAPQKKSCVRWWSSRAL